MSIPLLIRSLTLLVLSLLGLSSKGQESNPDYSKQRSFACIVMDAQTEEPLSMATLRAGRYGLSADANGFVEAIANVGDSLVFTHVGYLPAILEVKESMFSQNIVAVTLSPDTVLLSDVVVRPRNYQLSKRVWQKAIDEYYKDEIARSAFSLSKESALSGYNPYSFSWDASDNQRYAMGCFVSGTENKGMLAANSMISISSSSIIRAIKGLANRLRGQSRHNPKYDIKPLSTEEVDLLLSQRHTPNK